MTTRTEALGILAGTWEQKASWLRTHCADSVGARALAGAYAECAAALRALDASDQEGTRKWCACGNPAPCCDGIDEEPCDGCKEAGVVARPRSPSERSAHVCGPTLATYRRSSPSERAAPECSGWRCARGGFCPKCSPEGQHVCGPDCKGEDHSAIEAARASRGTR